MIKKIIGELEQTYSSILVDGEKRFILEDGSLFAVTCINKTIYLEWGENKETPRSRYEDVESYSTINTNVEDLVKQIINDIQK